MGDRRRFDLFASLIAERFPERRLYIADVASGKGALQAALRQRGYNAVTSWDRRKRNAKTRRGYRYGWFDYRSAPRDYDLVVAMHPDEATDQVIAYAAKHGKPFVVCPCCIKPTASTFWEQHCYAAWLDHLERFATEDGLAVERVALPMDGRKVCLVGGPRD